MKKFITLALFSFFSVSSFAVTDSYDIGDQNLCEVSITDENADLWSQHDFYLRKALSDEGLTEYEKEQFLAVANELNLYCTESDPFVTAVFNGFKNTQDPQRCQSAVKGGAGAGCATGIGVSKATGGNPGVGCATGAYFGANAAYGGIDACKPKDN